MALPVGITTCTVTVGPAYSYSGEEGVITGTVVADRSIVWSATGAPIFRVESAVAASLSGGQTSFVVPHVDQPGFVNGAGSAITGWYYTFNGRATFDGNRVETISKRFQVLVGQTTLDLDLVPEGAILPAVETPTQYVTSVNGETGDVTVTGGTGGSTDPEIVRDTIAAALRVAQGSPLSVTSDDAANTITLSTTATANSTDAQLRDRSTHTGTQPATTVSGLATVATTGTYADLSGKPTIPAATTQGLVPIIYASGAYPARPALPAGFVRYVGPTQPTDWLTNDEWVNNS